MTTLNQRLQDPGYKAWIKTGLCLLFAKEGLDDFADKCSRTFHQAVLNKLKSSGNPSADNVCSHAQISWGKVTCCKNCQGFVDVIDQQNNWYFKFKQENWDNSDIKLWPNDPWEMAKVFMNKGQKATQCRPVDTDLSGILNFIDHCVVGNKGITNINNLHEVRKARNTVMHSSTYTLSQTELSHITSAIVDLLEDPKELKMTPSSQAALVKVREVIAYDFDISKDNETKVLIERTQALQQKMQLLERDIRSHSESLDELESTGDRNAMQLQETIRLLHEIKQEVLIDFQMLKERTDTYKDNKEEIQLHLKTLDDSLQEIRDMHLENTQRINERLVVLETKSTLLMEQQTAFAQDQHHEIHKTLSETGFATAARRLQVSLVEEYKRSGVFDVPISPIYDGLNDDLLKVNIDEIYTDLVIVNSEKSNPPLSSNDEIPLLSYKDMFSSKGRSNRAIFLKGEAGVGKSTWCVQLLYAWVKTHDRDLEKSVDHEICSSNNSNDKIKDLEEAVSRFDYLFFVPLRYVKEKTTIKEAIFSSLLERISSQVQTVTSVIENCSDKVLIISDGLDEYTEGLSYEGLNQCTVITTTRPWKYDHICDSNFGQKVDIVLVLKGLHQSGIKRLTQRVCKAFIEVEDKSASLPKVSVNDDHVEAFLNNAHHCGLTDALKVPLTLIILLETFLERGSFSNSRTSNQVMLLEVLIQRGERKMLQSVLEEHVLRNCKGNSLHDYGISLFAENEIMSDYTSLLQKLSKLAFNGILNSQKEEALVFSEKQLSQIFTKDELHLCLKFGLLSQSHYFISMLSKLKQSVSFYHKIVQEFFAAAWIIGNPEAVDVFKKYVTSVSAILELENVFLFICGIDAHIGSEITKHFVDVHKTGSEIGWRVYQNKIVFSQQLIDMTRLMIKGQKEVDLSTKPHEPLYVLDMPYTVLTFSGEENTILKLLKASVKCLRYLCVRNALGFSLSNNCISELIKVIKHGVKLQQIAVYDVFGQVTNSLHADHLQCLQINFSNHTRLYNVVLIVNECSALYLPILSSLRSLPNLKSLHLVGQVAGSCKSILEVVPSLQKLENLTIERIHILGGDLKVQSPKMKNLYVSDLNISESGFIFRNSHELECVSIDGLILSMSGWSKLFRQLGKQSNLIKLEIKNIGKRREGLHLSKSVQMKKLCVSFLELPALTVCNGTDPEELIFEKVRMPESAWCELFLLFRFRSLKVIQLTDLNIGPAEIDLSKAMKLEEIIIDNVRLCHQNCSKQCQSDNTLRMQPNSTGWSKLFRQLGKQSNLIKLEIKNIGKRREGLHLSKSVQMKKLCVSFLELPALTVCNGTDPEELIFEKVRMPESAWCELFLLFRFRSLKVIQLTDLNIGPAEIDLSKAMKLEEIIIDNVRLCHQNCSKQCQSDNTLRMQPNSTGWEMYFKTDWEIFFSTLPTRSLRYLSLYNLDIGTAIINMDKQSGMSRICLGNVKMSRKAMDTLYASLATLKKLQTVDIDEVKVEEEIISMTLEDSNVTLQVRVTE